MLFFLVLLGLVLAAVLWGASQFAQGYFYTEPASGLLWRGPAAAGILVLFYLFWSLLNYAGGNSATGEVPYPVFWRFTNRIYLVDNPVPEFVSKKQRGEPLLYKLDKTQRGTRYKMADGDEYWSENGVEWIKLQHDGTEYEFIDDPAFAKETGGSYKRWVDNVHGWEIRSVEIGQPSHTSFFRLLFFFFLNGLHLMVWIAVTWLVLRFSLPHAILLGFIVWLAFTVIVLPVLMGNVETALRP
jgi:hypothetical protein